MATILSTGFENNLTGGNGFDSLSPTGATITKDASQHQHGSYSMKVIGSGSASTYGQKAIATSTVTGRVYIYVAALPATTIRFVHCDIGAASLRVSLNPNGRLQHSVSATDGVSPALVISTGAWYLIDWKFDTTTTAFTVDFRVSDSTGTLLTTATQLTKTGQTAGQMTTLKVGQMNLAATTSWYDDATATDQAADYPLGPGVSDDQPYPPLASFPSPSWLDEPARISDGVIFGMMTQNFGIGDHGQAAASESSAKAYRPNYIIGTYAQDVLSVPTLSFEHFIQTGAQLGHQAWPMIHPFGLSSPTTLNWPAGGLADFANGLLDATLQAWCDQINANLSATPFFWRLFREFQTAAAVYGPNGAANGAINETPTTFINAWRHIVTYVRARTTTTRFIWCPDVTTTPAYSDTWYPGDSYVDWVGVDAYATSGNGYNVKPGLDAWYAAYNPTNGTLGHTKPIMLCETAAQAADPNRIADTQKYTALVTGYPDFKGFIHWDSQAAGPYEVSDSPAGFLAAFQQVFGSYPFLASIDTNGTITITASDAEAAAISAADSEATTITLGVA